MFNGDRLILVNRHTGVDLCTCRHLGFSFAELARTLGKPCVHGSSGQVIAAPHCAST